MTGYDAFVIADSDIITEKDWLINLLRPLTDSGYGISTTKVSSKAFSTLSILYFASLYWS